MLQKLIQKLPRELQTYVIALGGVQLCAALQHLPALRMILHWYKEAGHLLSRDAEEWTDICVAAQWSAGLLLLVDSGVRQVTYVKRPREHLVDIILPLDRLQLWRPERSHDGCLAVLLYNVMTTDTTVDHRIAWARLRSQQSVALIAAEVAWRGGGMQDLRAICDRLHLPTDNWSMARYFANAAAGAGNLELLTELRGYAPELVEGQAGLLCLAAQSGSIATAQFLRQHLRRIELDKAVTAAIQCGDVAMAEFLIAPSPLHWDKAWSEAAAKRGDLSLLMRLGAGSSCPDNEDKLKEIASDTGNLALLQWMCSTWGGWCPPSAFSAAARNHHAQLLWWMCDYTTPVHYNDALHSAAFHGRLDLVKELCRRNVAGFADDVVRRAVSSALDAGQLHVVRWLTAQFPSLSVPVPGHEWRWFSGTGRLDILRWLVDRGLLHTNFDDLSGAVRSGNKRLIQWMHDLNPQRKHDALYSAAAEEGDVLLLEWLAQRFPIDPTDAKHALVLAAAKGNLPAVQWFVTQVDAQVNLDTLQAAVESGNLDLVKYLHSLGTIDAASRTVDEAAAAGRLHIAQWLHEHRQEGCTTLAMYRAARRGDLEMLRWLHEHYAVDCSRKTVHASATEGYMQVVQFLVSECAVQLRDYDLVGAAVSGHLPMLQYLLEQRPQTCLNDAVEAAVRRGHLYVIKFLYQQGHCTLIDAQWPFLKHADEEVKQWFIRHRPDSEAHERASDPNNDTVGDDDDKGSGVVV